MTYSAPFQFKAFPRLKFKNTYYEPFYPGQALDNGVPQRSKKESLSWSAKWKWNKKYERLKVKFWLCKRPALKLKLKALNLKLDEIDTDLKEIGGEKQSVLPKSSHREDLRGKESCSKSLSRDQTSLS